MAFKLQENGVLRLSDNAFIPNAPGNRDWQEYQEWLQEGNTPEPRFTPKEQAARDRAEAIRQAKEQIKQELANTPPPTAAADLANRVKKLEIAIGIREPEV